jgi:glutaredoxin 3
MAEVIIYSTGSCPFCLRAKALLDANHIPYTEHRVDLEPKLRLEMEAKTTARTVPQIFINNQAIGGYDSLYTLHSQGRLMQLLKG